jgi:hypothetical protein
MEDIKEPSAADQVITDHLLLAVSKVHTALM